MLTEETPYGEIANSTDHQKCSTILLRPATDSRIGYLGNGDSDPDAKVVLIGHSQGRMISRGVCYPGFGSTGA